MPCPAVTIGAKLVFYGELRSQPLVNLLLDEHVTMSGF
jgi:hypothetical protein